MTKYYIFKYDNIAYNYSLYKYKDKVMYKFSFCSKEKFTLLLKEHLPSLYFILLFSSINEVFQLNQDMQDILESHIKDYTYFFCYKGEVQENFPTPLFNIVHL